MDDQQVQLSLEVGGEVGAFVVGEFTLSGKVASYTQSIERDENVFVRVVDADGQVIMQSEGWVKSVAIETVPATQGVPRHTKRKHAIKLGESAPITDD